MEATILAMSALAWLAWGGQAAPSKTTDSGYEARLKKTGLAFQKDKDGDYRFELRWDAEKRSQLIYVRKESRPIGDTAVREVFALCWQGTERPAADVLERLLVTQYRMGAFRLEHGQESGKWTAYFSVQVPDSATTDFLGRVIRLVAEAADNMERDTVGTDAF